MFFKFRFHFIIIQQHVLVRKFYCVFI